MQSSYTKQASSAETQWIRVPHHAQSFLTTTITPPPHAPPHLLLLTYPVLADCNISRETRDPDSQPNSPGEGKLDVSWRQLSEFHDSALESPIAQSY